MTKPTLLAAAVFGLLAAPAIAQEPNFGRAIALEGDDLLIGQPVNWYGPGVVYAYRAGTGGSWTERAMLTAPDSARKDDFGASLALDGNTLLVGAPRKRDGSGVAYAFTRADAEASWVSTGIIEPPAGAEAREFATALALSGDELLIGSPSAEGTGAVYRYLRSADGWRLDATLTPAGSGGATGFGSALGLAGDRLLIGAPGSDAGRGRLYAASRTTGGWGEARVVPLPEVPASRRPGLGSAVHVEGDRGLVGVPGSATVFVLEAAPAGEWTVAATLRPEGLPSGSDFGAALAAAGGELWVGAPGMAGNDGRVYRFVSEGSDWRSSVVVPDDTEGDSWPLGFGQAIAAAEDRAVVGMPTRDFGEGRALAFTRSGDAWEPGPLLEGRIFRLGEGLTSGDRCEEGRMGDFPCTGIELVSHMSIDQLGGERGVWVNDVWGWTDPETGRNYALVARRDGASFVDVTEPAAPRLVGNLPRTRGSRPSVWRDIKVIGNHAYVVSDGAGQHGMQVFDLTRLRDVTGEAVDFEPDATYDRMASAHNVVADPESGFLYIVGANSGGETCGGGLHIVDARDPEQPSFAGCYHDPTPGGSRGYTHDAQCLVYEGPDEDYRGRQICVGSNESEMNIADVTDKQNPRTIARASYPNVSYAHQGWFDDEQRWFYMNDEGDESAGVVDRTRTMVWDLTDLDDPILANQYFGPVPASDHNLFVVGDRMYQSNYGSGLRVLDISDRANPVEIAHFDSAPLNDDGPGFSSSESGAWSNYPFFPGGYVIFTSVREGLFIVRVDRPIS